VRYCDSEQKVAIAEAGLETVPDFPANTQFLKAGGAVSVDEKHDKRLQLLINVWHTLPDRKRLISLISDRHIEDR